MSPAKPVDHQTPSSTRERTAFISSPATLADPDVPLLPSRPVSLPKSEREEDNRVKQLDLLLVITKKFGFAQLTSLHIFEASFSFVGYFMILLLFSGMEFVMPGRIMSSHVYDDL